MYDEKLTLTDVMEAVDEYLAEKAHHITDPSTGEKHKVHGTAERIGVTKALISGKDNDVDNAGELMRNRKAVANSIKELKDAEDRRDSAAYANVANNWAADGALSRMRRTCNPIKKAKEIKNYLKYTKNANKYAKDATKQHIQAMALPSDIEYYKNSAKRAKKEVMGESVDDLRLRVYEAAEAGLIDDVEKFTMLEYLNLDNYE